MSRTETPGGRRDPGTRTAALWATAVAVPVAVLVGWLLISSVTNRPGPAASPSPTPARAQATTAVSVPAAPLTEQSAAVCRALVADLPVAGVRDLPRRPVSAGAEQNAAYGDPPITLSCGVKAPSFPPTDLVYVMNGVCWHAAEAGASSSWTTVDRRVPVQVSVPATYPQPGQWVNEFSAAVGAAVPSTATAPAGC